MKVLCNLTTKKIEGFLRWDDFDFNPLTHVVLDVSEIPDMEFDKLNATNDGIQSASQSEIDDINFNRIVDAELAQIDSASIRSIREYIASKPDAPQILKDHENNAAAKRATRKP